MKAQTLTALSGPSVSKTAGSSRAATATRLRTFSLRTTVETCLFIRSSLSTSPLPAARQPELANVAVPILQVNRNRLAVLVAVGVVGLAPVSGPTISTEFDTQTRLDAAIGKLAILSKLLMSHYLYRSMVWRTAGCLSLRPR